MLDCKLAVMGGGGVGKSALTVMYTQGHFLEVYDPTIEDSYRKQQIVDGETCQLDILDTAGQEEYTSMRDSYVRSARGFLLVYSLTDRGTFKEVTKLQERIMRTKDVDSVPIVLVGNKCDLEAERSVPTVEGSELGKKWGCIFMETSAKKGLNVEKAFTQLVRAVQKEESLSPKKKKEGKGCTIL
ncbi:hypothetical protein PROFUN_03156 [Planoprotostelium fungivorum]|uniref:small monomeric GTPase n=1 Tax=Planoprotostelium fungivorum TaxID=1890364 RepID=A0A2P6NWV6_9EUKA|nr:hypothetical protein PROFUN_03156 [Planoprotostelium fungivorum]